MDIRFASPQTQFGAPESSFGAAYINGIQALTRLVDPGIAAEYILLVAQVDSADATRVGWVNAAFGWNADLRRYADTLAKRIALFPLSGLVAIRLGIRETKPTKEVLGRDATRSLAQAYTTLVQYSR